MTLAMDFEKLTIYLQCSPQTEEIVHAEFLEKCQLLDISIASNELPLEHREYTISREHLSTLLPYLKCPNRVLIRVSQFKVRDFPKLYQKLLKIDWSDWIGGAFEKIHVTSSKSRLIHSDRIEKSAREAIERYLQMNPIKKIKQEAWKNCPCELFIRIVDDVCTVSIDASGEKLSQRGYRKFVGIAPLRENRAATILYTILRDEFKNQTKINLLDPFVGSGTFLLELSQFYKPNTYRKYYLHSFFNLEIQQKSLKEFSYRLVGIDHDSKALEACRRNFQGLQSGHDDLKLIESDIFKFEWENDEKFFMISNPPYDERISVDHKFHQNLIHHLTSSFKNASIFLLLPKSVWKNMSIPSKKILAFSNSGIDVELRKLKN
ncbi:MAG: hypothetical protein Fur0010_19890 [Bdellovibrio sp.]